MRRLRARYLIASGARARWIEYKGGRADPVTVAEIEPERRYSPHGPAHVAFESVGGMRHGPDARAIAARRLDEFARQLAEDIEQRVAAGEMQRLGIVAPARLLKAIREHLGSRSRAMLAFQLARDLTKHPNHTVHGWLSSADLAPKAGETAPV
jgi:protein required for attachment to host cells